MFQKGVLTDKDKAKLRELCELQDKYLEKIPKTIRDTDFSTSIGVALQCNMDILREVACRLGHGFYPHQPYIREKMECMEKYLKDAGILTEPVARTLSRTPVGPVRRWLEGREICRDILKKLEETRQVYIVDHDIPLSISKRLFDMLDAKRKEEAKKRGVPENQFEFEDIIALLLGFPI